MKIMGKGGGGGGGGGGAICKPRRGGLFGNGGNLFKEMWYSGPTT